MQWIEAGMGAVYVLSASSEKEVSNDSYESHRSGKG